MTTSSRTVAAKPVAVELLGAGAVHAAAMQNGPVSAMSSQRSPSPRSTSLLSDIEVPSITATIAVLPASCVNGTLRNFIPMRYGDGAGVAAAMSAGRWTWTRGVPGRRSGRPADPEHLAVRHVGVPVAQQSHIHAAGGQRRGGPRSWRRWAPRRARRRRRERCRGRGDLIFGLGRLFRAGGDIHAAEYCRLLIRSAVSGVGWVFAAPNRPALSFAAAVPVGTGCRSVPHLPWIYPGALTKGDFSAVRQRVGSPAICPGSVQASVPRT